MFRYVGFSWSDACPDQAAVAHGLEQMLRDQGGWRCALALPGQRVYMTGHAHGVNGAYALPAHQGVVLGRLFRRGDGTPGTHGDVVLTDLEAQRIVQSQGRTLVEQFWGRYVAFLPSATGEPRVLRDPTGTLPCYRLGIQGVSIVLSWLEDLCPLPGFAMPSVDWDAVAAHLVLGQVSGRSTLLAGVTQLLAGELAPMSGHGSAVRLWSAADCARRPSPAASADAIRLLRNTVAGCVGSWASCYRRLILRLSGGVDSAILLGQLSSDPVAGELICLNYYSPGTDSDERPYARLAARRCGALLVERTVDDRFRLDTVLDVCRTPTPANHLGFMASGRIDAEVAAAHQADAVFNGAGGDQLFFEARCTWPAADYLSLRGMDRGFARAVLDAAHLGHVSFWKALRRAMVDRSFKGDALAGAGGHLSLMPLGAKDAALRAAPRFVHPGWLEARDLPIGKFNQLGMVICPFEYYNPYQREAAPERVQPLMSQPLLELCLATPTYVLTEGGQGRALARRAFGDRIPREIAIRRSKGGAASFINSVLQRDLRFARELLLDGLLVRQGLLDRSCVLDALADRPSARGTHVTEIHAFIAAEAWLQRATAPVSQPRR